MFVTKCYSMFHSICFTRASLAAPWYTRNYCKLKCT